MFCVHKFLYFLYIYVKETILYEKLCLILKCAKMNLRCRRTLHKLIIITLVSTGLFLYQIFRLQKIQQNKNNQRQFNFYRISLSKESHKVLDGIFISVKTAKIYHSDRLPIILKTWFQLAKKQIWFFTDAVDLEYHEKSEGHLINTNCSSSYNRLSLCCKMSVEFDTFIKTDKQWFCHFDDDNYVNVDGLAQLLSKFNPFEDWYLGRPSIEGPINIFYKRKIKFWFATGGAGFCISRALALKMAPFTSNGRFISIGDKIRSPDDVTIGFVIGYLLGKPLTVINQFHSHLEPLRFITKNMIHHQISFSYSKTKNISNIVEVDGFSLQYDPNRFLSLHCILYPKTNFCP